MLASEDLIQQLKVALRNSSSEQRCVVPMAGNCRAILILPDRQAGMFTTTAFWYAPFGLE